MKKLLFLIAICAALPGRAGAQTTYVDATVQFPSALFTTGTFIAEYLAKYTDPATGWAAAFWDDAAHTRRRKASLFDGTIAPAPVLSGTGGVLTTSTIGTIVLETGSNVTGYKITCGWPAAFINDIEASPQPGPEYNGLVVSGT